MNTWYDYRSVWAAHHWVFAYALLVLALIIVSVIGTIVGGVFAVLFVPSLAGLYLHHLIVARKLD